ncbi:MAG TPA: hypothetical protein VH208_13115, partial [Myxococcaceae bacterium]|nr:hypothetical protein [Myxococcaceae bacterium]
MDASAETSRSTCLSALALERLDANLLQGRELIRARTHLASCASCRQRFDRMQADASTFRRSDRALSARRGFARAERRQRMRWTGLALAGVALAVAAPVALKGAQPGRHAASPQQLHARTVSPLYLEPRGGGAPVRLRHLSIQGED